MNLHNDLQKVKIPHSCENCCRRCSGFTTACIEFYPSNMTEFMDNALNYLRTTIVKAKCEKKLTRYIQHDGKSYNDGITTLDGYYVQLINTALAEIRRGRSDYVYSLEQVRDIMRFEPLISVRYIAFAGAYEIRKGAV